MENASRSIRRYITLLESEKSKVRAIIESYLGVEDSQLGLPPFPTTVDVEVEPGDDQDATTIAVKHAIETLTGYEPARFTWRPIEA